MMKVIAVPVTEKNEEWVAARFLKTNPIARNQPKPYSTFKKLKQLTVNVAELVINVVAAINDGDVPLNSVQPVLVNLIMDTLGALALATEPNLCNNCMWFFLENWTNRVSLTLRKKGQVVALTGTLTAFSRADAAILSVIEPTILGKHRFIPKYGWLLMSYFDISADAFGENGWEPASANDGVVPPNTTLRSATIPASSTVYYDVELVSFEKEKGSWELTTPEKIETFGRKKEEGNTIFKKQKRLLKWTNAYGFYIPELELAMTSNLLNFSLSDTKVHSHFEEEFRKFVTKLVGLTRFEVSFIAEAVDTIDCSTHIPAQPVSASSQHNNRHQHIRMSNTRSKRANSHSPYGYRTATAYLKNGPTPKKYPHDPGYGNPNGSVDVSSCGGNDTKTNGQVVDAGFVEQALCLSASTKQPEHPREGLYSRLAHNNDPSEGNLDHHETGLSKLVKVVKLTLFAANVIYAVRFYDWDLGLFGNDVTSNGFIGSQAKDVDLTRCELALLSTPALIFLLFRRGNW
ncbi:Peptidyl-prolyl cis-trans isomerase, FKBP-type [Artemisia annua]|uniref:Peptidyl-prolyl cis-trans isomerase, FKBP-type n=1 Tax=Artemisia annua TaxID=35608 RepID=A0A2U1PUE8_ARTAN|nr:Peptidyl-prolyl cis-trans isomerase, FKBP-type [Artemisia annua]